MAESGQSYFEHRAAQERQAAERASDPRARKQHEELARLYVRAAADPEAYKDPAEGNAPVLDNIAVIP